MGPSDPMGWVGIGFLWVRGCTFGSQRPHGVGGHWVPLGAGVPMGWVGIGSLWVLGCTFGSQRPHGVGAAPHGPPEAPPPPAQQQSQREVGETREQHIGRVLAQVAPGMMLCSLSEVICFCLGEPWGAPNGCCGGALRAAPWAISGCSMGAPMGVTVGAMMGAQWAFSGCHDGCHNGAQWVP